MTAQSTLGTQTVTGTYGGDAKHNGSNGSTSLTVSGTATQTAVNCGTAAVAVGDSRTCGATVTADSGTPAGNVAWSTDKTGSTFSSTSCALSSGSCSTDYTPAPGSQGAHTVTGSYAGNSTYLPSSGNATVNAVNRTSQAGIDCGSSHTINVGGTCTVTVTDAGLTPTGSVNVTLDGNPLGSCTLSGGTCDVTYTPVAGTAGAHTLGATYAGDANHNGSNGSQNVTVAKRASATSIVADACQNGPVDAPVTCTITVNDGTTAGTAITPAGTVSYTVGTHSTNCPAGSSGYVCTFTPTSVGTHPLSFAYSGGANHVASSTSTTVNASTRSTSTTVACGSDSAVIGEARDCTVTVTDTQTAGTASAPSGQASVLVDGVEHGTCTLVASGSNSSCAVSYTGTVATATDAPHSITAGYPGQGKHAGSSTAQPATLAIAKAAGSVSISNIPTNAVFGGEFTPTFTKAGNGTASAASKTATVCTVGSDGKVSFLAVGECILQASVAEGTSHLAATGAEQSFSVAKAAGSVSIGNIPTNAVFGGEFTPTFTKAGNGTASAASKTATVCAVGSDGKVSFLTAGTCTLQASVAEGTNHLAATGAEQSFTIASLWTNSGYFAPVDMNTPTKKYLNLVKAGSTVPLKFRAYKDGIEYKETAGMSFAVKGIACDLGAAADQMGDLTTGSTALRYDGTQFVQNWKTPTVLGCYQANVLLPNGSLVTADFRIQK